MGDKHRYLIALGSNLGNRAEFLTLGRNLIDMRIGTVTRWAEPIETSPIGSADQLFLNSALICESCLLPTEALECLHSIEIDLGRIRTERWGNRTLDLDMILAIDSSGHSITQCSSALILPHPEMHRRSFVLQPCAAIAGEWLHPILNLTVRALCDNLTVSTNFPQGAVTP